MTFIEICAVYAGSDGRVTRAMYDRLEALGPAGVVAVNLFRTCKNSERAKKYRKRSSTAAAYDTKEWAMRNLCEVLTRHGEALGIVWGWKADPATPVFCNVLYVEIPTGQVSFHTRVRGAGPDYPNDWDGVKGLAPDRICRWITAIMGGVNDDGRFSDRDQREAGCLVQGRDGVAGHEVNNGASPDFGTAAGDTPPNDALLF